MKQSDPTQACDLGVSVCGWLHPTADNRKLLLVFRQARRQKMFVGGLLECSLDPWSNANRLAKPTRVLEIANAGLGDRPIVWANRGKPP